MKPVRLSKIEIFILNVKRTGKQKQKVCPNFWRIAKGLDDIPAKFSAPVSLEPGEVLFILRLRSGLTQRRLAQQRGVTHQTIYNWENAIKGHSNPEFADTVTELRSRNAAPL